MSDRGWLILSRRIAAAFAVMALANGSVWRTQSTEFWVTFETFVLPAVLFVAFMAQAKLIERKSPQRWGATARDDPGAAGVGFLRHRRPGRSCSLGDRVASTAASMPSWSRNTRGLISLRPRPPSACRGETARRTPRISRFTSSPISVIAPDGSRGSCPRAGPRSAMRGALLPVERRPPSPGTARRRSRGRGAAAPASTRSACPLTLTRYLRNQPVCGLPALRLMPPSLVSRSSPRKLMSSAPRSCTRGRSAAQRVRTRFGGGPSSSRAEVTRRVGFRGRATGARRSPSHTALPSTGGSCRPPVNVHRRGAVDWLLPFTVHAARPDHALRLPARKADFPARTQAVWR